MRKSILYFVSMLLFASMQSACKKVRNQPVTVIRDCTGTYLRSYGKDYHVCNLEAVSGFTDGENITATFKKIKACNGSAKHEVVCMMVHENEGWIEVKKVK